VQAKLEIDAQKQQEVLTVDSDHEQILGTGIVRAVDDSSDRQAYNKRKIKTSRKAFNMKVKKKTNPA
jgi:hypothetical protein